MIVRGPALNRCQFDIMIVAAVDNKWRLAVAPQTFRTTRPAAL
jgi:hypothetical protein